MLARLLAQSVQVGFPGPLYGGVTSAFATGAAQSC